MPPRDTHPNWKVDPLLSWAQCASQRCCNLGEVISVDEQTIGFQGHHADKMRITHKQEGDGFQRDALCQDGCTCTFCFRNQKVPSKHASQVLSPLHARVLSSFDALREAHHRCQCDKLHNSVNFTKRCYLHPKKVLVAGVCHKNGRGVPASAFQEEIANRSEQMKVRGTVKFAILKGDPSCPNMLVGSVHDSKPVHMVTMITDAVRWTIKTRRIWSKELGKLMTMSHLRLNVIDSYNNSMGHVDLADQPRLSCRWDWWMRKRKWWWAFCFWAVQMLLVNAHVLHVKLKTAAGIPKKSVLSHLEFRRAVHLAWLAPDKHWPHCKKHPQMRQDFKNKNAAAFTSSAHQRDPAPHKGKNARKVNNESLDASTGVLRSRLTGGMRDHAISEKRNKHIECQLHRHAAAKGALRVHQGVMFCGVCGVNLCQPCWNAFHAIKDLSTCTPPTPTPSAPPKLAPFSTDKKMACACSMPSVPLCKHLDFFFWSSWSFSCGGFVQIHERYHGSVFALRHMCVHMHVHMHIACLQCHCVKIWIFFLGPLGRFHVQIHEHYHGSVLASRQGDR